MTTLIPYLEPGMPRRSLWDSLPIYSFIELSRMETFHSNQTQVVVKLSRGVASLSIEESQVGELPFGKMWLMTSRGLAVAYRIDAPRCKTICIGPNYAALALGVPNIVDQRVIFNDGKFVVIGGGSSLVASIVSRRWMR